MVLSKHPTLKERRFVKEYLRTGSKRKAILAAYDTSEKNASIMADVVWKQQNVQSLIKTALQKQGLDDDEIALGLKRLLEKTMPKKRTSDPGVFLNTIKEINKLRDNYPVEKKQIEKKSQSLNIDVSGKTEGELLAQLEEVSQQLQGFKKILKESRKLEGSEDGEIL